MAAVHTDILYSNDHFIKFITSEISYLDIRFFFPTEYSSLKPGVKTFTINVSLVIGDITINVKKAVGYELPACVEIIDNLTSIIKERILNTIHCNLKVVCDTRGEAYSFEIDYIKVNPFILNESYSDMLKYVAGSTDVTKMRLDNILDGIGLTLTVNLAMTEQGGVGYNDRLPWWLPDELRNFRTLTTGKLLVVGYKTFSNMGPLRNRVLLVMTSNGKLPDHVWGSSKGIVIPVDNYQSLLAILATTSMESTNEVSVIGGPKTIDLFKGKFDIFNQTIVDQSKVEVEPNVFITTDPKYFLEDQYTGGATRDSGDGWKAVSYRRT